MSFDTGVGAGARPLGQPPGVENRAGVELPHKVDEVGGEKEQVWGLVQEAVQLLVLEVDVLF